MSKDNLSNTHFRTSFIFYSHLTIPEIKGIVHLNIIFSYMKVNKKCNLDHPVY